MKSSPLFATLLIAVSAPAWAQSAQKPDENRFSAVDVIPGGILDEPMAFEVLEDGTVYVAERKGRLMRYDPASGATIRVDSIAINHTYVNAAAEPREAEEGLVGFTVDPNFEENHWAYFLYAHPTIAKHVLSRMELRGNTLVKETEVVLLEFDVQRETCCHTGGGMTWDQAGNLYVTTGNNTGNVQGSQTDQRPGRMNWDDQRGAANTNDLRGKILRIRPQPDGTYTIPEGNLFPPGTAGTRPEIYTMGHRNVWRVSVDSRTGFIYWGEVGPDAAEDAPHTVAGEDELNQARGPGFFGWPYFIGDNRGYPITDYTRCVQGDAQEVCPIDPPKDPSRPLNDSRWNSGLRDLPPAQPAFISYPYGPSERFPEVGTGGRSATGGPVYRRADFADAERPWPEYYEGKWLATDLARGWIMSITMDADGDYLSMERFLPSYNPIEPIDMKFGPDGDLYVLEYGSTWFRKSEDSRLVRIEYNAGNRAPEIEFTSSTRGGSVPFEVVLSATGTRDPDDDPLTYEWRVAPADGGAARTFEAADATVSFDTPGDYDATLTVRDPAGATSSRSMRIVAGNREPEVAVNLPGGNRTFYFPDRPLAYEVRVTDAEDGTVEADRVAFSIDYVPEDFDAEGLTLGDSAVSASTQHAVPLAIIGNSDCRVCHQPQTASLGPSFSAIASRYEGDGSALEQLVSSIRGGSTGRWGDVMMPAHPGLSTAEASAIARYILSIDRGGYSALPLSGRYTPQLPEGDDGRGSVIIRAAYTDRGANGLTSQTTGEMLTLRSPTLNPGAADAIENAETRFSRNSGLTSVIPQHGGLMVFEDLDLTGVDALEVLASVNAREGNVGGVIELRLGSPAGAVIAQGEVAGSLQPAGPTATEIQEQGGGGGRRAPTRPVVLQLPGAQGVHDVYLAFRNPRAGANDPLMTVNVVRVVPR